MRNKIDIVFDIMEFRFWREKKIKIKVCFYLWFVYLELGVGLCNMFVFYEIVNSFVVVYYL